MRMSNRDLIALKAAGIGIVLSIVFVMTMFPEHATKTAAVAVAAPLAIVAAPIFAAPTETPEKCEEPENPFEVGSGHYAGYEWAATHSDISEATSASFQEGADEADAQEDEYDQCVIRTTK